jgi:hypothetical protein
LNDESLRKSSRFDQLDEKTQLIIHSLLESCIKGKETAAAIQEIQDQMETLIQVLHRVDVVSTDKQHWARAKIIKGHRQNQSAEGTIRPGTFKEITAQFEMLDVPDSEETKVRLKVQEAILETLSYPEMTERYEDIVEAFPDTFEWAFKASTSQQTKWDDFSEWLKTGSGVYWISGKAGSGKSTLMKHIFDHAKTRQYLELWVRDGGSSIQNSQGCTLCLATFFFWNSGTSIQKSHNGLLRALLHQVLSKCPDLISVVFPEMWAKKYSDSIHGLGFGRSKVENLPRRVLTSAFRKLAQQDKVPLKLCFLIDGLDEFSGDHEELASLFQAASMSPNVKMCLSSRPLVIFEQIYASRPSLRLQDLTYSDIEHYVRTKFNDNSAFHILQERDAKAAKLLRDEVIDKAEGVFLWVELVVKSLLLGIRNQDDVAILRQRLVSMPQKLEDLYVHFLGLIEPVYLEWSSRALQIVRAARDLCTDKLAGPTRRDEGSTLLSISTFFFAMSDNVYFSTENPNSISLVEKDSSATAYELTQSILRARCSAIKTHLTARCAGLLEVPRFEQEGSRAMIRLHHRTARDFLYSNGRWDQISGYTKGTTFDPHKALFEATVFDLAMTNQRHTVREVHETASNAMLYAWHINTHQLHHEMETQILDALNEIMIRWRSDEYPGGYAPEVNHWMCHVIGGCLDLSSNIMFLKFATLYGLANYVGEKLRQLDRESAAQVSSSLLFTLLPGEPRVVRSHFPFERPEMISTLLSHGADQNLLYSRDSRQTTSP